MTSNFYSEPINRKRRFPNPLASLKGKMGVLPKRKALFVLAALILLITAAFFVKGSMDNNSSSTSVLGTAGDDRIKLPNAKADQTLNKEFSFPLKDDKGKEISSLKYIIESAEIRDQIVVKGQKATSVDGRTFLLLNLKLVNEYTKSIEIRTGDYVRLSVNGNEAEWLAADMHNDPVEVQAISTKHTRVGFPINDTDKNLKVRVGEIEGQKEIVELNLQ